ncbi:MAG TPA: hypothetical protein VFR07_10225 [Mycobacteriales bacterium]|nr:hypothetical protein [Mycobacteriales bacterium]
MADPRGHGGDDGDEGDGGDEDGRNEDGRSWLERAGPPRPPSRHAWLVPASPLLAGAGCAVVAGLQVGLPGIGAGLAAGLVVLAFFSAGALPWLLDGGLAVLLVNYVLRLAATLFVLLLAAQAGLVDQQAVGVSLIVCALVRVNAQVLLLRAFGGT